MTFSKWDDNGTQIRFEVHDENTLPEVLEEFTNFLRACGYMIEYNKILDIVDMDE